VKGVSPAAMKQLQSYGWPGNIREVRNSVERAMLLASSDWLEAVDFPIVAAPTTTSDVGFQLPANGVNLEALERSLVQQALERCGGNQPARRRSSA
jgi:two-component system, NtrC family, response regulator AtoC